MSPLQRCLFCEAITCASIPPIECPISQKDGKFNLESIEATSWANLAMPPAKTAVSPKPGASIDITRNEENGELVIPARAIAIVSMQEYEGWGLT